MIETLKNIAKVAAGMTDAEFAELLDGDKLKPDAQTVIVSKYQDKIKGLEAEKKAAQTEAYNKAVKEWQGKSTAELAKGLKKELKEKTGFEFDSYETIVEGVEDLLKTKVNEAVKDNAVTDDKVKAHPAYKTLLKQMNSEYVPKTEVEKIQGEFEGFKKELEKKEKVSKIADIALKSEVLKSKNFGKDPDIQQKNKGLLVEQILKHADDWQITENEIIPLDSEGKRRLDGNKNPVNFDTIVKESAFFLPEHAGNVKGSPAYNRDRTGGGGGSDDKIICKTKEEFNAKFKEYAKNPEMLAKLELQA